MDVEFGDGGLSRKTTMKFTVIRAPSPYNVILGRSGLKAFRAIQSTIHAMMKFPTPRGIATLVTRSVAISECRRLEDKQAFPDEATELQGDRPPEEIMVNPAYPDQLITIGGNLTEECKTLLKELLARNMDVFAWEPSDMTGSQR
ncbi:reverse transcriptase domain-containing protein [Artemisia annua]|uniref:Reverse transcriptase domain-containing protein n=1 Tax=Artemisia annua TaxID=35608 RepID=A0A2U1Q746_ARTAN|nr:reverse transcriptase domain-containing protein [Artemisia annua]